MTILFLALWLQMSASTTGISHLGSVTVDHGKVVSTQIACIKTYADGAIEYKPCEISTEPPTTNFVQPADSGSTVTVSAEELKREAQMAADETDGKPPSPTLVIDVGGTTPVICRVDEGFKHDCKPYVPAAAEPVDVPAVQEPTKLVCAFFYSENAWVCTYNGKPDFQKMAFRVGNEDVPGKDGHIDTCTDKSRVLLTSEDGKKHCIKF